MPAVHSNTKSPRIAIIGAGPVGLSLALQLRRLGAAAEIDLFDAQPDAAAALADPRVLALSEGSRQLLAATGAWPQQGATSITRIHVSQLAPGLAALPRVLLQARDSDLPALGYTLRYGQLLAALQAAARRAGIAVQYGRAVQVEGDADGAHLVDEPGRRYGLAVLAEGGAFHTQAPRVLRRDYAQKALVGRVRCDRPHGGLAVERFTAGGPVALLPLGADYALVWCVPPAAADAIAHLDQAQQKAALQALLPAVCGRVTELQIAGSYPLGLNAELRTRRGRVVQLGNAAQTLHPVAGQGLNLGLRDAATLAQWLASPRAAASLDAAGDAWLRGYDRKRLPDRIALLGLTDLLARGFTWQAPGASLARAAALAALAGLPPLRSHLQNRMVFGWRR
ncbi:2-octaprenyl-6-methoxyphenol hydroxylase [mine drainage metagenome]|uniref:2-octaprenyl-6-methoxyphenol hydroxylase n=1 Tax=mine drainage metagenome TaxID=410659 RepID=A0A1J5QPC8_9ZZZZ